MWSSDECIALLDIGSSKVACLIVFPDDHGSEPRFAGLGHQRSLGVKAGVLVDPDEAEQAVRAALDQAERMAGAKARSAFLSVSCGRLRSTTFSGHADLDRGVVGEPELSLLARHARAYPEREGRALVALNRFGYQIDGEVVTGTPRGLAGRRLTADYHAVTADESPLRTLRLLAERCDLTVAELAPAAYASALAATAEEERQEGVICIDIGGGTTALATFVEGHFVHVDSIPVGGNHLTYDIARALETPLADAERIKTLYGTMVGALSDQREVVSYQSGAGEEPALQHVTKARLGDIVRQRTGRLLQLVQERLDEGGVAGEARKRIVLTGGTSQLPGIGQFAADALGAAVCVRRPAPLSGMPGSAFSPAFSTVMGLAAILRFQSSEFRVEAEQQPADAGRRRRIGRW